MGTDAERVISEKINSMSDEDINALIVKSIEKSFKGLLCDEDIRLLTEVIDRYDPDSFSSRGAWGFKEALTIEIYERYSRSSPSLVPEFEDFERCFEAFFESLNLSLSELLKVPFDGIVSGSSGLSDEGMMELKQPPCRDFGELDLDEISRMPAPAELSEYMIGLVKYFKAMRLILDKDASSTVELIEKMTGAPGYLRLLDRRKKYEEVIRLYRIVRDVDRAGIGSNPQRDDFMVAIGILLFNLNPSEKLVSYLSALKPSTCSDALLYEYNAILALNNLLMGLHDLASVHARIALHHTRNKSKKAYIRILQGCIAIKQMNYDKAIQNLSDGSSLVNDGRLKALISFYTGTVYFDKKDYVNAINCFEVAKQHVTDTLDLVTVHNNIGSCAVNLGDWERAEKEFEAMENLAGKLKGEHVRQCRIASNNYMGIVCRAKGEYDRAVNHYKKVLKSCIRSKDREGIANQLGNMGIVYRYKREYDRAIRLFNACMTYSEKIGYWVGIRFAFWHLYQVFIESLNVDEAKKFRDMYTARYPELQNLFK